MLANMLSQLQDQIHNSLQSLYDWFLACFGGSYLLVDTVGIQCLAMGVFWFLAFFYTILDLTKRPSFFYKYKVQKSESTTLGEVKSAAKVALMNQLTVQVATIVATKLVTQYVRPLDSSPQVPSLTSILLHLVVFVLIQEIAFYYLHRLLHHGKWYKTIHKTHHRFQAPIALSATYCHPLEHFLANLFPVILPVLLLGSHRSVLLIWLIIVLTITLNDHSGYNFPWMPSPEFHDYHHEKFNQNFGRMGFLDYFHGTSDFTNGKSAQKQS